MKNKDETKPAVTSGWRGEYDRPVAALSGALGALGIASFTCFDCEPDSEGAAQLGRLGCRGGQIAPSPGVDSSGLGFGNGKTMRLASKSIWLFDRYAGS
ncbi:hypothetical protein Pst134EA_022688 [Puccinia striiformis f. sp. tritici]|uniref:hypothetical protein n=1 Tax=Puccinia striiformis f. sp. tritici TaxID=168172 RepID=UPI0020079378|nr:hypothetical protein Pst134EA_022688 [Puccinia striiformis f. sp. tritici]KAH9455215.1 hypothetical protein Pst134EA_022688 [Puccinia striiformis f. sp. tritici]